MVKTKLAKSLHKSKPKQLVITSLLLGFTGVSLLVSLLLLVLIATQINETDIPPQEGQLLNRISIEKAAQLMEEQTVIFGEEL